MTAHRLTVGAVEVTAVRDVVADFPHSLPEAFPAVDAAAWAPHRRRYPEAFDGADRWRLPVWCFMVRAGRRVVLVDTGVGGSGVPGAGWIGTPGRLPEALAAAGTGVDEVDLVVLTHLHLDHVGWNLAGDGGPPRPRFPRARYLVQRADWEAFAARPDWGPGSDVLPAVARQTRRRLLDRLEREAMWLAPAHFPEPFGTVTRDGDGRHWTGRR